MTETRRYASLKFALIPAIVMAFFAIYPQLTLWYTRGSDWHGSYYVSNYDETAYSAYVNALTAGKPRINDPFIDGPEAHESLYSIQFIPAYFVALPTRLLGLSTSTAFIFLCLFIAVFSSLSLFWLIHEVTGDDLLSAVGVLIVLCLGTAASFQGELRFWLQGNVLVEFFPFLRRYQPGVAFGLFFFFCIMVRRAFSSEDRRSSVLAAGVSGLTFAALIFSYFYLWTAAAAWFGVAAAIHFLASRESRPRILVGAAIVGGFGVVALIPYFGMLVRRSSDLDNVGVLTLTHSLDFSSPSLIIGLVVAVGFVLLIRSGRATLEEPRIVFGLAFAVTPLVLFNQQIVTGRSLQPVHYGIFIANYIGLVAAVLLASALIKILQSDRLRPRLRRAVVYVGILATVWGFVEAAGATGRSGAVAYLRDESVEAIRFADVGATAQPAENGPRVMLATNFVTSDFIPTVSTLRPLWNPHTSSASGITGAENKRLFYVYLYFSGFTDRDLDEALRHQSFEVTAAIFGPERALPALGGSSGAISAREIDVEVDAFRVFSKNLDAAKAFDPEISYLLVPAKAEPNYSNLDKWYIRDKGMVFGLFKLYTLTRRSDS